MRKIEQERLNNLIKLNLTNSLKQNINLILDKPKNENKKLSPYLTYVYYEKYYPELLLKIEQYKLDNNLVVKNLSELIYCITNDLKEKPKCSCGNFINTFINYNNGYNKFCSAKCKNNNLDLINQKNITYNNTVKKKYSINNISQLQNIKDKKVNTMLSNYGVAYNSQRIDIKNKISNHMIHMNKIKNSNKRYNLLSQLQNINIINLYNKNNNYLTDLQCTTCNNTFTISQHLAQDRHCTNNIICTICNPILKYYSKDEKDLFNFIKANYNGKIIENDRKILNGKELDIYLPEMNLAIEFNGLYWHSELFKHKNYHYDKLNICKQNNINLIHIFEDDWLYKQNIIKSRILNKLGKSNKIYARKCKIKIVNNIDKTQFLIENHIQGNCISKYNFGLYYNDELVSIITFGERKITSQRNMELLRFCNKLNTTVIGGASKLFKHFINNYDYNRILSYADKCWSTGNLYKELGFTYCKDTVPNYYWIIDGLKENRYNWRKDILIKNNLLQNNETENKCMHRLGYNKIYDCGSQIWDWSK